MKTPPAAALRRLAGHLVAETDEDERRLEYLYDALAETELPDDVRRATGSDFSIARSDLFFDEAIPRRRRERLEALAERIGKREAPAAYRVFVREVPIREPLLHASVPEWAAGARAARTVGPFDHVDGRKLWFDFYRVAELTRLFVQGTQEPVLLFPAARRQPGPGRRGAVSYRLGAGTVWVRARVLSPSAPAGGYVGLTISGGRLSLSAAATAEDGDLTVASSTEVQVELDLATPEAADVGEAGPYGEDARRLRLEMPGRFAFHFAAADRGVDRLDDAVWELYGEGLEFSWDGHSDPAWEPGLRQLVVPLGASAPSLRVGETHSPLHAVRGDAAIARSGWALPVATIDTDAPPEAGGTGSILVEAGTGIGDQWAGLAGGPLNLTAPTVMVSPGTILWADLAAGNAHARHELDLWRDETNPFGSSVVLTFPGSVPFFYATTAAGVEIFMTAANAHFRVDRPVQVDGAPPEVRSLDSLLLVAASDAGRLIYLFDDNLLQDAALQGSGKANARRTVALALTNALFTVSRPNGCLLFGTLDEAFGAVERGVLFFTFRLFAYLPTLPDPYAARLVPLEGIPGRGSSVPRQPAGAAGLVPASAIPFNGWLVCRVLWDPPAAGGEPGGDPGGDEAEADIFDDVRVSFHFAPLDNQFGGISLQETGDSDSDGPAAPATPAVDRGAVAGLNDAVGNAVRAHNRTVAGGARFATFRPLAADLATPGVGAPRTTAAAAPPRDEKPPPPLPDYPSLWDATTELLRPYRFALLDVSTNADLFGVSFYPGVGRDRTVTTHVPVPAAGATFPIQVEDMDVVSAGLNVKAFTVPQISWEPLINLSQPFVTGDPPPGFNYYPDDGGPTQILNNSTDTVTLAPLPLTDHLLRGFEENPEDFAARALMTLPFGMKALAELRKEARMRLNAEAFENDMRGGLQLQLNGGEGFVTGMSDMFEGRTLQLNNVLNALGQAQGDSTLGRTVTKIFNNEFLNGGVPLERIDLSGYGASTFSNWFNTQAAFAQTSQARFDVFVGRCAHEVIQVRSMVYPWGIRVVRTITIFRVGSGYVYRHDSGWRAESAGRFDFRFWVNPDPNTVQPMDSPYRIHPGIVRGLFNVQNIVETDEIAIAAGNMKSDHVVDEESRLWVPNPDPENDLGFELQPVFFDADVEIEGLVAGFKSKTIGGADRDVVPSKRILGYVQVAPQGVPITEEALRDLVALQLNSIGGAIDCEAELAGSGQKMRLTRFDFNNSFGANGSDIAFAVAGRGQVLLPKDGAWSMVKHERATGEVTPVPANISVPVIRVGMLERDSVGQLDTDPASVLLRIAQPTELLRAPDDDTLNFGFLQSTDTQKALFLTPSFEMGEQRLFSKSPPLFVDAFRIVNSKSIFPNVGDGESNLGEAISLVENGTEFLQGALQDGGANVWQLMDLTASAENAAEQGFQLLKQAATFDLPDTEFELIDVGDGNFRIYIEYEQDGNQGDLDFNIDSMAGDIAETWKSRMGNIGLVVDLAGISRLMTIRGNWDSKKAAGAAYPEPELVFADALQPVIDILEILQQLQGGDYAGAVANGLKLAMSNKAGTWEYKFEASKEIPVLRFPVPDAVYNDPNTPFKLECGLKLGAYFNAAVQVTNDANELLPSAGGLLGFYGRLSVMCVSISAATVYAIGQVNLDIMADTKVGPSLRMKFGFGAQIVVGLPVAGNVSVLFVVGVEIFAASGQVDVTAFMLFEGHAEILGGIVAITIRIEARGTVSKKTIGAGSSRTDLACQVTFGLDISIFLVINISFEKSWSEQRQIA